MNEPVNVSAVLITYGVVGISFLGYIFAWRNRSWYPLRLFLVAWFWFLCLNLRAILREFAPGISGLLAFVSYPVLLVLVIVPFLRWGGVADEDDADSDGGAGSPTTPADSR